MTTTARRWSRAFPVIMLTTLIVSLLAITPADANVTRESVVEAANTKRDQSGSSVVVLDGGPSAQCAADMFAATGMPHPDGCDWDYVSAWGEISLRAPTDLAASDIINVFMASPSHRKTLLDRDYTRLRFGQAIEGDLQYVIIHFALAQPYPASGAVPPEGWGDRPGQPGQPAPPSRPTDTVALDVRSLQVMLADLGYYDAAIDGDYGPATQDSVAAFQRDNGMAPDGMAGPATVGLLAKTPTRPAASQVLDVSGETNTADTVVSADSRGAAQSNVSPLVVTGKDIERARIRNMALVAVISSVIGMFLGAWITTRASE